MGGYADRRSEEGGGKGDRGAREERKGLVRWRYRDAEAERRYQYGDRDPDYLPAEWMGQLSRGRDAAVRFDPASEERETRLKANGFFRLLGTGAAVTQSGEREEPLRMKLLLVDNDDCFIHTLANYARQTGAEVVTYRAGMPLDLLRTIQPDLILISPGPGRPADFGVPSWYVMRRMRGIPVFGVCLGLQGIVEAFGGELGVLSLSDAWQALESAAPRRGSV